MKEPQHRPSPAFYKAADADEHKRQQRIAALTGAQRQDYKALETEHRSNEKSKRNSLKHEHAQKLSDRMRAHLTLEPQPCLKLREPSNAPDDKQLKRMRHAVDDFLAGRKTRDTNAYALQLQQAEKMARGEFKVHSNEVLGKIREDHQQQRDQLLEKCEKDHARDQNKAELKKNAKDITWNRALEKAASQEKERSPKREFGKAR